MKRQKYQVCLGGLLFFAALISAAAGADLSSRVLGPSPVKLGKLTTIGTVDDAEALAFSGPEGAAVKAEIIVFSATSGFTGTDGSLTYPYSQISLKKTSKLHLYVDFLCTATTRVTYFMVMSGPMTMAKGPDDVLSVKKNVVYRQEFIVDGDILKAMGAGLYDFLVIVGPPIDEGLVFSPSGGSTEATARIRVVS